MQTRIDFLGRPRKAGGILTHFEARHRNTAGVGRLARGIKDAGLLEEVHRFGCAGHVGPFAHGHHAVGQQGAGVLAVQLVLRGRRQGNVGLDAPRFLPFEVLRRGIFLDILTHAAAVKVFQLHDVVELLAIDAVGIVHKSIAVGHGEHLTAQLEHLLGRVLRHIARTGDEHGLAFEVCAASAEHFHQEIDITIAGGFGTDETSAKFEALAGEHTGEFARVLLICAEHVAHFATAHADIAGGHVAILTDVAVQLEHEGLAETHHLGRALAAGGKIRSAFGSAHGEGGQRIFERLFEGQELENAEIDRAMETNASLVGADGVVVLHTIAHVGAHVAAIVGPRDAEGVDALRDAQALHEVDFVELGVLVVLLFDGGEHFFHSLVVLRLVGETCFERFEQFVGVHEGKIIV